MDPPSFHSGYSRTLAMMSGRSLVVATSVRTIRPAPPPSRLRRINTTF
jgi:hypothetical protein